MGSQQLGSWRCQDFPDVERLQSFPGFRQSPDTHGSRMVMAARGKKGQVKTSEFRIQLLNFRLPECEAEPMKREVDEAWTTSENPGVVNLVHFKAGRKHRDAGLQYIDMKVATTVTFGRGAGKGPPQAEEALAEPAMRRARVELSRPALGVSIGVPQGAPALLLISGGRGRLRPARDAFLVFWLSDGWLAVIFGGPEPIRRIGL